MLHELLLALSGHPSPLFDAPSSAQADQPNFPLLAPAERALLQGIGRLSELHRKLRIHLEEIRSKHPSIICRAVAVAIQQTHLGRFQQTILHVESKILQKDASVVGAYDIVPLASVVGEFDHWHRRMAWYWELACFMAPNVKSGTRTATGAQLIDKLRLETQTGFPDIENTAIELARVAETAWIKQLASWVVYGKLPQCGREDFCIQVGDDDGGFKKDKALLPAFITPVTANSILFIGKSLHQIRNLQQSPSASRQGRGEIPDSLELDAEHLKKLSALELPVTSSQMSQAIASIRLSLSQNVLKHLLPMALTIQLLSCLRQFFLLGRGEFALSLISEVEKRVSARQQGMGRLLQQNAVKALQGLAIKDAELNQVLQQTWRSLLARVDDGEDAVLEFAQKHISLATPKASGSRPSTSDSASENLPVLSPIAFNDLLFPNATGLALNARSPLDLFISAGDLEIYSTTNAYLLGIKRGCIRLSDLWRHTSIRRETTSTSKARSGERLRHRNRAAATRKVWATCSAANFLLSELAAFFEGEIIRESCAHFQCWVEKPDRSTGQTNGDDRTETQTLERDAQRDPETLATGHRAFLDALTYALLLTDLPYTKELRSLLGNTDKLTAFFTRLLEIQQKSEAAMEAGGEDAHAGNDEQHIALELDRARKRVDSDLKSVVHRLRQLDAERIGALRYLGGKPVERGGFESWKGGGVDRLLMKLEFGRMLEGSEDTV